MRQCGKILQSGAGHRRQYGACALHAGYLRLQTHTQGLQYLLLFHGNNGCTNGPQCYVIRKLTALLALTLCLERLWCLACATFLTFN